LDRNNADIIRIEGVSKRYGRTLALDDVSLNVKSGELFALLGPNGAGKTTLVHILSTILQPDSGKAFVAGSDVVRQPLRARRNIGVVFQEPSLDDRLTVFENLEFHGLVFGVPRRLRRARIKELLEIVELADWRDSLVRALSGGMKRRLEIARALVHDARILFLDEPTTGLDAQSRARVWEHVAQLQRERELSVVVTTHYIDEVENSDAVCIIEHGKILVQDSPELLKTRFGQELMRVTARDEATTAELRQRFADRLAGDTGLEDELLLRVAAGEEGNMGFVESFLAEYGNRLKQIRVDQPTLESVFLSLTGRELRDEGASARDRTYAFGKRGGEHTK
jgi:ABC-2 type transport system ATP-binding protein